MNEHLRDWLLLIGCVLAMWLAVWLIGWQLARTVPHVDPYNPSNAVPYVDLERGERPSVVDGRSVGARVTDGVLGDPVLVGQQGGPERGAADVDALTIGEQRHVASLPRPSSEEGAS